jgi:hypothetical protein
MCVGQFAGTIQIGDFTVSFDDLLKADERLRKKGETLPCQHDWSLAEWNVKMNCTDMELLAISSGGSVNR